MNTTTPHHAGPTPDCAASGIASSARCSSLIADSLLALASRFAIAGIFFLSGRTKVDGC